MSKVISVRILDELVLRPSEIAKETRDLNPFLSKKLWKFI